MIVKDKECFNLKVGTKVKIIDYTISHNAKSMTPAFVKLATRHLGHIGIIKDVDKNLRFIKIDNNLWFLIESGWELTLEVLELNDKKLKED